MFDPFLQYGKIALTSARIVILVINNAMAKIAIQIKSSPPGAGFYLLLYLDLYVLGDVALIS